MARWEGEARFGMAGDPPSDPAKTTPADSET
jgi:hypothetical protein